MSNIRNTTLHSLKWSLIERIGQFSIQLIITIVLARMLEPEQYAVIGILNIFIVVASVLVDAGFSQGLIRKKDCTTEDYNSVFWVNLSMSVFIYVVLYAIMPWIGDFFDNLLIVPTGRVLMLLVPIQALNVVQTTIVNKKLQFSKIAKYTLLVSPISGIIGVLFAYFGYGVWALVWQSLAYSSLMVLVFWFTSSWKPVFRFSLEPISDLLGFSLKLSLSSLLNSVFNNLSPAIIAKFFDKAQFGYFTQAQKYAMMPSNLMESVLNRMTYPILATIQDDQKLYADMYRKMQMNMFIAIVPFMSIIILCAHEIIILTIGDKWAPSIPFFQILCFASITLPFHPLAMSNLKVFGKSNIILNLEIIKKVLIVVSIACGLYWGILGLVWGQAIYFWISLFINMHYAGKDISYSLARQLSDVLPSILLSLVAYMISMAISHIELSLIFGMIIKALVFFVIYVFGVFLIPVNQFTEIKKYVIKL